MLALRLHDERHARAGREKAAAVHSATTPSAPTPGSCQGGYTTARLGRSRMAAVSPCVAHLASPLLPPALHLRPRAGRISIKTGQQQTLGYIYTFWSVFINCTTWSFLVCASVDFVAMPIPSTKLLYGEQYYEFRTFLRVRVWMAKVAMNRRVKATHSTHGL